MLILTRRIGETITIGDDITVTVLVVRGNQVRLGINAPDDVSIHREEIYYRIKALEAEQHASESTSHHMVKQNTFNLDEQEQDA